MNSSFFACTALALGAFCSIGAAAASSSYTGQQQREIKALSTEEVQSLLAGKGMGQAKAAELNGYPGPLHVLQLATELRLTDDQRAATQAVFDSMQSNARSLGVSLVQAETELDRLFAGKKATPALVAEKLEEIGRLQAKLRQAHLEAHLSQTPILSAEQIALYARLRGYTEGSNHSGHRHAH